MISSCHTGGRFQIVSDDGLLIGAVPERTIDDIRFDISVKNGLRGSVPVEGDGRANASQRQDIIRLSAHVQRENPKFRFLSEYQELGGSVRAGLSAWLNQFKPRWTGTSVTRSIGQTKVRTSAAITSTSVRIIRLPQRVNTVNVHGKMKICSHRPIQFYIK